MLIQPLPVPALNHAQRNCHLDRRRRFCRRSGDPAFAFAVACFSPPRPQKPGCPILRAFAKGGRSRHPPKTPPQPLPVSPLQSPPKSVISTEGCAFAAAVESPHISPLPLPVFSSTRPQTPGCPILRVFAKSGRVDIPPQTHLSLCLFCFPNARPHSPTYNPPKTAKPPRERRLCRKTKPKA
jgi:hypothetical protein